MHHFDPTEPLTFPDPDPARALKESALKAMSNEELLALYNLTRAAASEAHKTHDMEKIYPLVRGMKTLHRITGERGFVIRARRISKASS